MKKQQKITSFFCSPSGNQKRKKKKKRKEKRRKKKVRIKTDSDVEEPKSNFHNYEEEEDEDEDEDFSYNFFEHKQGIMNTNKEYFNEYNIQNLYYGEIKELGFAGLDPDELVTDSTTLTTTIPTGNTEWIANERIMIDSGCTCMTKHGDKCTCNSFDWADDMGVFRHVIKKYNRPTLKSEDFYEQNGFEFCVLKSKYVMVNNAPNIYLFGVTKEGNSVSCKVYAFWPYFYLSTEKKLNQFQIQIMEDKIIELLNAGKKVCFVKIEEATPQTTTNGYHDENIRNLYKITLKEPSGVSMLRGKLEEEQPLSLIGINVTRIFVSNVDFILRFETDINLGGTQWIMVDYIDCIKTPNSSKKSSCQIDISVNHTKLKMIPRPEIPPMRMLSFDIECISYSGKFPSAEIDPAFQICSTLYNTTIESKRSVIFTLGTCNKIGTSDVYCFCREENLLLAFKWLLSSYQPNIITGYNINKFDLPYLFRRAKQLVIDNTYSKYTWISEKLSRRDNSNRASIRSRVFESKAYGRKKSNVHNCSGIITMDLYEIISRQMKLGSYKLNNVARVILGDQKDDVHHTEISKLFNRDREGRTIVAEYCDKDALLPVSIIQKRKILLNMIQLSRVTGGSLTGLIEKGQTYKVKKLLLMELRKRNMIFPTLTNAEKEIQQRKYKGAYVENPLCGYYGNSRDQLDMASFIKTTLKQSKLGYYEKVFKKTSIKVNRPITCLDFKSLYPTIIIAHNLCYTTQTNLEEIEKNGWIEDQDYHKTPTPTPHYFVTPKIRKGILPTILEYLLDERDKVKAQMKIEKDPLVKKILDGKQLGLKISANSVYGFTGSLFYPNRDISESVTGYGQVDIKKAKKIIEEQYTIENGYEFNAVVVYG